jgi:hypothetical protein
MITGAEYRSIGHTPSGTERTESILHALWLGHIECQWQKLSWEMPGIFHEILQRLQTTTADNNSVTKAGQFKRRSATDTTAGTGNPDELGRASQHMHPLLRTHTLTGAVRFS